MSPRSRRRGVRFFLGAVAIAGGALLWLARDPVVSASGEEDPSATFCSEIIYHGYHEHGVDLWALRASMSAPGLVRWLGGMGVREFTSLVPSDLEHDPQVRAVAEWRNALRVEALVSGVFPPVKEDLARRAQAFRTETGYEAPYWALVELARQTLVAERPSLAPSLRFR